MKRSDENIDALRGKFPRGPFAQPGSDQASKEGMVLAGDIRFPRFRSILQAGMEAHLKYHIPDSDQRLLRSLIGRAFHPIIVQRACDAAEGVVASTIAVQIGKGQYVRFSTYNWADTPRFAIDCFHMRIVKETKSGKSLNGRTRTPVGFESIQLVNHRAVVERIEIYSFTDEEKQDGAEESVSYDAALLFYRTGGDPFLIYVDTSTIAGDVGIAQAPDTVGRILAGFVLRHTVHD